jgi:Leucine-rich repeat (LRR) protein
MNLQGTIPNSIGDLTYLYSLYVYLNFYRLTIPRDLSFNKITGQIPTTIGNIINLGHLYLNENNLTGTIPSNMGYLDNLQILSLGGNNLNGIIPVFPKLSKLQILDLHDNHLVGSIPQGLKYMQSLKVVNVSDNNLSGVLEDSMIQSFASTLEVSVRYWR